MFVMDESQADTVKSIKAIDKNTVHKICSGQVVLNLATAVKELVENSLDAGASNIEVKFKNYGLDLIEVSDDGSGVVEENFSALTLKYHTSKLQDFSDLLGVKSFGFRGEALSSLCALSHLVITTKHESSPCATKIEYDYKGNIKSKTPCSRTNGTTVTLSNLFSTLPVRQKEFQKNHKREFMKMTQILYAYCLISVGVKIICTNQTKSGQKTIVVATQASNSYRDNLACIFGAKQLQSLLEIKPYRKSNIKENLMKALENKTALENDANVEIDETEIDLSEESNDAAENCSQKSQSQPDPSIDFVGYISSCVHGSGRSTTDRQFYFVNSRPCDPNKISKLVNEVYRQYNINQYPFVFLNLIMERDSVDINVTPDKRQLFLTKEKLVLDLVKNSLVKLFETIPSTVKIEKPDAGIEANMSQPRVFSGFLQRFKSKSTPKKVEEDEKLESNDLKRKSASILEFVSRKIVKYSESDVENSPCIDEQATCMSLRGDKEDNSSIDETNMNDLLVERYSTPKNCYSPVKTNHKDSPKQSEEIEIKTENEIKADNENQRTKDVMFLDFTDQMPNTQIRMVDDVIDEKKHTVYCKTTTLKKQDVLADSPKVKKAKIILSDKDCLGTQKKGSVTMKTSLEHVKALVSIYTGENDSAIPERIKFRSGINPVFNKKCEEELSKEISKESFKRMEIMGQFNLGFIITRLEDDLFIIDQHATDEIYNFETLQKTTELTSQKLVIPQQLELTGVNEQILIENLDIFKSNGFTFEIDEEAPPTKRVKLATIPMSKSWIFGKEDIEEMLFMLKEDGYQFCRPSRIRAMFASRACRKSVMIGTALSKADMRQLVEHMAEIDKPWNCPHGRPTIRHLVNMAMVQTKEDS